MRKFLLTSAICAAISGCGSPCHFKNPKESFQDARKRGNTADMALAVGRMAKLGWIRRGISVDEVRILLGPEDTTTGIYNSHGISIGYGRVNPTVHNYEKFYWVHLGPKDFSKDLDSPWILHSWEEGRMPD